MFRLRYGIASRDEAAEPLLPTHVAARAHTPPVPWAPLPPPPPPRNGNNHSNGGAPPPACAPLLAALASSSASPLLRRGAWLRVDGRGRVAAFAADRHTVGARCAVPARDVRLLDPTLAGARCGVGGRARVRVRCCCG
jgi:hypothetical protein